MNAIFENVLSADKRGKATPNGYSNGHIYFFKPMTFSFSFSFSSGICPSLPSSSSLLCFPFSSSTPFSAPFSTRLRLQHKERAKAAMGRSKLEIRYREDFPARRSTYMTRMKGVRKKASELSLLCGVDVLVASFSPELNTLEFWPKEDTPEFNRIRERYLCCGKKKKDYNDGNSIQQTPSLPMPSPSCCFVSFRPEEEMAAMEMKQNEVRNRLSFLRGYSQNEKLLHQSHEAEEQLQAQFMPLQQDFYLSQQPSQQDMSYLSQQPYPFTQWLSPLDPLDQPSSFSQSGTPCLADFNFMDLPKPLLLCDSPLRSHADDLAWCDSLLLDHEYRS